MGNGRMVILHTWNIKKPQRQKIVADFSAWRRTAIRKDKVKAIIAYEPGGTPFVFPENEMPKINGELNTLWLGSLLKQSIDMAAMQRLYIFRILALMAIRIFSCKKKIIGRLWNWRLNGCRKKGLINNAGISADVHFLLPYVAGTFGTT